MAGGMGGGWGKRGSGIPLADRVRAGQPAAPRSYAAAQVDACPARHCWVSDAADRLGVKRPGLLVEWRALDGGWEGRVLYPALLRPGSSTGEEPRWALVEEWLPAELLTPC